MTYKLHHGDCLSVMREMPSESVGALVTDPPAGIAFMSKAWDKNRGGRDQWIAWLSEIMAEALRLLKPGAHGLIWAIPRTSHWTGMALEDAGFEVRDRIAHHFGTGFPKGKSQLKPATEDWWLVRKPGKGKLNVDECRVKIAESDSIHAKNPHTVNKGSNKVYGDFTTDDYTVPEGRWPANAIFDEFTAELLDAQSGERKAGGKVRGTEPSQTGQSGIYGAWGRVENTPFKDSGGASRFFYCAKASRRDRGEDNTHPTVKSTELMRYLCRLITSPGGTVLDPFAGSGSTGVATLREGFYFIGIEQDASYVEIARRRLEAEANDLRLEVS